MTVCGSSARTSFRSGAAARPRLRLPRGCGQRRPGDDASALGNAAARLKRPQRVHRQADRPSLEHRRRSDAGSLRRCGSRSTMAARRCRRACGPAAPTGRGADHGADADRLGRFRGRPRRREMRGLERLSAIPLHAAVIAHDMVMGGSIGEHVGARRRLDRVGRSACRRSGRVRYELRRRRPRSRLPSRSRPSPAGARDPVACLSQGAGDGRRT